MTIRIKAMEQYFPVVLFIVLYKAALTLKLKCNHSNKTKLLSTEQYFPVVLFIMLHKVALAFEFKCDYSNESD